jgi:hypothetical protein
MTSLEQHPPQQTVGRVSGGPGGGVTRGVVTLAVAGTVLLALGAFWLSFTTLRDLAVLSGIPAGQAWVWPLIVDGVILEATISVVALRNSARPARRFAWVLLAAGAGVSVAANITHAIVTAHTQVPALIASLVASVPPLVLLAMTHLTVELTRNSAQPSEAPRTRPDALPPLSSGDGYERDRAWRTDVSTDTPASRAGPQEAAGPVGSGMPRRRELQERARELRARGVSRRAVAAELGVHPTTVGRWEHAPDRQQDGADDD